MPKMQLPPRDFALEARLRTLLRKGYLFELLENRATYLVVEDSSKQLDVFDPCVMDLTLREFCEALIKNDPDFAFLKD